MGVSLIDYALAGLLVLSAVIGVVRGFFREAMSLLVWAGAIWAAADYGHWLTPLFDDILVSDQSRLWAARLGLLVGCLVVGHLCAWLMGMLLHSTRLAGADRALGMVFGLLRGVLLTGLVIIGLRVAGLDDEPWWQQSKLIPYAAPVADALQEAAEWGFGRGGSPALTALPDTRSGP
jgi:membrane protein required for colicin V production